MKKLFAHLKAAYIFLAIALGIFIVATLLSFKYQDTRNEIFQINKALNLQYVQGLAQNLSEDILRIVDKNFHDELMTNALLHDYVEADLKLFITTKFKDIRLLVKPADTQTCMIAADGNASPSRPCSENEQLIFSEIHDTGEPRYVVDSSEADIWATYYAPIISHNKVQAVIVIKFSMFEQRSILGELAKLGNLIESIFIFFVVIVLLILWFAYFDFKREGDKNRLLQKLETSNQELSEKTKQLAFKTQKAHELFVQASQNLATLNEAQRIAKIGSFDDYLDQDHLIFSEENYRIWEIEPGQAITQKSLLTRVHPEDMGTLAQHINTTKEPHADGMYAFRIMTPDGGAKHILARESAIFDDDGIFIGIRGTHQDISEKVKAEEKEQKQNLLIMHQNRLAMQGEMLEMIAHQWRQPLNTLSLTLFSLYVKIAAIPGVPDDVNALHEKADHAIQYLSRTIDDFKSFFAEDKSTQRFSPAVLLDETLGIIDNRLEQYRIDVNKNYDAVASMQIESLPSELGQVLLAIINNAIDALKEVQIDRQIFIDIIPFGDHGVHIEIVDNAGGIPHDVIPYIFEPYFSTKKDKNGTGLGLYMAKMIMEESLGGSIAARTENDRAIFTLILPGSKPQQHPLA
ncbi:ATP-binding protein [Sulfurimonas sp. HSL1-6]|uniref:ATP-binding protein n=1 Tax=Thiomicrolovo immobilis TaxID=3131935 RepID=UPI0031F8512E